MFSFKINLLTLAHSRDLNTSVFLANNLSQRIIIYRKSPSLLKVIYVQTGNRGKFLQHHECLDILYHGRYTMSYLLREFTNFNTYGACGKISLRCHVFYSGT